MFSCVTDFLFTHSAWLLDLGQLIATICVIFIANRQLKRIKKTHSFQIDLALGKEIIRVEQKYVNTSNLIVDTKSKGDINLKKLKKLNRELDYYKSIYLDLMDKLCLSLNEKYIEGSVWKGEYNGILVKLIESITQERAAEKYKNMYQLYKKWNKISS